MSGKKQSGDHMHVVWRRPTHITAGSRKVTLWDLKGFFRGSGQFPTGAMYCHGGSGPRFTVTRMFTEQFFKVTGVKTGPPLRSFRTPVNRRARSTDRSFAPTNPKSDVPLVCGLLHYREHRDTASRMAVIRGVVVAGCEFVSRLFAKHVPVDHDRVEAPMTSVEHVKPLRPSGIHMMMSVMTHIGRYLCFARGRGKGAGAHG